MSYDEVGKQQCVVVFTCRGKERMIREGGSQAWRLDASRASKCKYVVCVQNRNQAWGQASAPHKQAFLIAEISEIVPTEKDPSRQLIKFKSFADIAVPDRWEGNRNPVAYARLSDFGINTIDDLDDLPFTRLGAKLWLGGPPPVDPVEESGDEYEAAAILEEHASTESETGEPLSLTFEEARQGLARRYGVLPENVEILIRG